MSSERMSIIDRTLAEMLALTDNGLATRLEVRRWLNTAEASYVGARQAWMRRMVREREGRIVAIHDARSWPGGL